MTSAASVPEPGVNRPGVNAPGPHAARSRRLDAIANARRYVASVKAGETPDNVAVPHLERVLDALQAFEAEEQRQILAEIEATEYLGRGDEVMHIFSGWTGIVASVERDLVTVDPVCAGGKTWAAITVERAELRKRKEAEQDG
jgi:preprotein translocase subunit YajC